MNEEVAFLTAITAQPDDDTAHLVYADWLDEHDRHDEAELQRVRVEIRRLNPPKLFKPVQVTLRSESDEQSYQVPSFPQRIRYEKSMHLADLLVPVGSPVPLKDEEIDILHDGDIFGLRVYSLDLEPQEHLSGCEVFVITVQSCSDSYPHRIRLIDLRQIECDLLRRIGRNDLP